VELDKKKYKREYYLKYTKKYHQSFEGRIKCMYQGMKKRVKSGKVPKRNFLSVLEFTEKCINDKSLKVLFQNWVKNNYDRNLTPTPDRINFKKGYSLDNIQFLSKIDNTNKGTTFEQHFDRVKNGDYEFPSLESKWCNLCKRNLNRNKFGYRKKSRDKLSYWCKKCCSKYNTINRRKNRTIKRRV
jgi:hypothetical protein